MGKCRSLAESWHWSCHHYIAAHPTPEVCHSNVGALSSALLFRCCHKKERVERTRVKMEAKLCLLAPCEWRGGDRERRRAVSGAGISFLRWINKHP